MAKITFTCNVKLIALSPTAIPQLKTMVNRSVDYTDAVAKAERASPGYKAYEVQMLSDQFAVLAVLKQGQWVTFAADRKERK